MTRTLPEGWPDRTLGWGVLHWTSKFLVQPDGPNAGARWHFTDSQRDFILWLYAVDGDGRWVYHRAAIRRAKGTGKTPMLAALCLAQLCGPVEFDRFDSGAPGGCVGRESAMPWVQIAATNEYQTTNTMSMVLGMAPKTSRLVREYALDVGKTVTYKPGGGRLEAITASSRAAEGGRPTFVVKDEPQLWAFSNGGHALSETIHRNLGKTGGRAVEAGNAHVPGEDSVAERTFEAFQAQLEDRTKRSGILYDAVSAPNDVDMSNEGELRAGLAVAYVDAPWVDLNRIVAEVYDPSTPPEVSRLFYLNQPSAASDAWLAGYEWSARVDTTVVVADRDVVTLGFDGSRKRSKGVTDATALIGCRVSDGHVFELGVWEQPESAAGRDWEIPVPEVEAAVRQAFDRYHVVGFYADPARWEEQVTRWEATYGERLKVKAGRSHPCQWWMSGGRASAIVRATDGLHSAVVAEEMTHDGSYALTRHVLNARRRSSAQGVQIAKDFPDSPRKIDAAVAAVLAYAARLDAQAAGVLNARTKSRRIHRY